MEPLRMFELTPVGIVIALAGGLYLLFLGSRFLPRHKIESLTEEYSIRQFLTEVLVNEGSPLAGKSIQNSGFMEKFGAMILGIIRNREKIIAPDKNLLLEVRDLLLVEISAENLSRLRETPGIEIRPKAPLSDKDMISHDVGLAELTVAYNSHLVGKTLKETNFRQRYGLTALAVYRHGETLIEKIGRIKLRFGDVLLVQGIRQRILQLMQDKDFMLLQEVRVERRHPARMLRAAGIMAVTVIIAGFGPWPVTVVFLCGCVAMVLFKCLPSDEAYSAINWHLVTLLGGMIALGRAMEVSGTAEYLARLLVDLLGSYGPMALLSGFFFLTVLLTQPMSNNAAALLVLPIAIHAAHTLGVNPRTFAVTVTFAASCSFMTPFEPCCVLVYGPGRYRFMDFVRAGILLTGLVYIVVILLVPLFWKL
jgi:di/tricarboxylate transporter